MTKKDFQAIAAAIYQRRVQAQKCGDTARLTYLSEMADDLARIFPDINYRFSRDRFIEACETGKCKGMRQV